MFCQTSNGAKVRLLAVSGLIGMAFAVPQQTLGSDLRPKMEDFVVVQAVNRSYCSVLGRTDTYLYPRSVGRKIVMLAPGSRLTTTTEMGNVSLIFPPIFETPGPRYGDFLP